MKRDYGTALREYIRDNCKLEQIVDFADYQIFDSAITYTGIFLFSNTTPKDLYSIKVLDPKVISKSNNNRVLFIQLERFSMAF